MIPTGSLAESAQEEQDTEQEQAAAPGKLGPPTESSVPPEHEPADRTPAFMGLCWKRQRGQTQPENGCSRSHQVRMSVIKIIKQGGMVESDRGRNVCGAQKRESHKINMYLNNKKEPRGYLGQEPPRQKNSKCTGSEVLAT